ncbi:hypothetical protein BC332_33455 [Capsicum chinense]|nr:hypothetical protein BC332_33455 [Capsicum chinense]
MKDLGVADVILGIRIHRIPQGLALSRSHYIEKVLDKFKYMEFGIAKTPLDVSCAVRKNEVAPVCIHCDSQAAIGRAGSMMYNGKSRHIRRRHNIVRELLSSRIITVDYMKLKDNVSDPLTKGLSREGVERTSKEMSLRPRTSQHGPGRLEIPRARCTLKLDGSKISNLSRDGHVMFTMVIKGLCEEGKVKYVKEVMKDMVEKGVEPNIFSYNILIYGYCKKKKLAQAMRLFCEISQKGLRADIVTYNTILQGLFEVGRTSEAKRIYAEMLSVGPRPDLCTHSTFLDGYFKYGLVEEAMSLFDELERKREYTDIAFFSVVINGLCKNGLFDEAKGILRKMEDNGCPPDSVTYNVIVQGFLRCNDIFHEGNGWKGLLI